MMTKKERELVEQLMAERDMARALRWPDYAMPTPMSEAEIRSRLTVGGLKYGVPERVAIGWFKNYNKVTQGCSNGISHNSNGDTANAQGAGHMYRSKVQALQALRHTVTAEYARHLASIDADIETARGEEARASLAGE